jgi:hypothetical protein
VNVAVDPKGPQRTKFWEENLLACLNTYDSDCQYVLIGSKNLVGVLMCLLIRKELTSNVRDIR